jgi:replicative DNA helicase
MGADSRVDDARWLLEWIARNGRTQFSRRDAHQAARGRFHKATDLEPALALLEEHGYLRRVDADPAGVQGGSTRLAAVPRQPSTSQLRTLTTLRTSRRTRF